MIHSAQISVAKVASHYDELDSFYQEIWGPHVHHGYWKTGKESVAEATTALIDLMTEQVQLNSQMAICDVGCGYGETSRYLSEKYQCSIKSFTVSKNQYAFAIKQPIKEHSPEYLLQDWLENKLSDSSIDLVFSIESSEHMPNFNRFFSESSRVLTPAGKLAIFAWLEPMKAKPWMKSKLLQPLCDEGRMRLATVNEYEKYMNQNGLKLLSYSDLTRSVSRTWTICIQRAVVKILSQSRYRQFLMSKESRNREFAKALFRIRAAYALGAMKYGLLIAEKHH